MANQPREKKSQSVSRHPIRIVPLHRPEAAAPAAAPVAAPHLTYRNGPLLTNVEVFTIFWGASWQQPPQSGLIAQMNQFFDFILSSALLDQLGEYSVPGKTIGHGKRIGTTTLITPDPGRSVQDSAIQKMLQQEISSGTNLPKPMPNTLYFVMLPPGVRVLQRGTASCQTFCGYHDATSDNIFYAVMPYPGCPGCTGGLAVFDALTSTTSHELCEAITDPVPGQGWYDDNNGEIGDICAWKTRTLGGYTIQLEWSNRASTCV
ncbi:MAG: hypothetical protein ACRD5M_16995 [Candidatus Acidiferrales bacterium]